MQIDTSLKCVLQLFADLIIIREILATTRSCRSSYQKPHLRPLSLAYADYQKGSNHRRAVTVFVSSQTWWSILASATIGLESKVSKLRGTNGVIANEMEMQIRPTTPQPPRSPRLPLPLENDPHRREQGQSHGIDGETRHRRRYRRKLLAGLCLPFLLASLDLTIVSTAIPFIASHFSTDPNQD
jgi:hypothetical protein